MSVIELALVKREDTIGNCPQEESCQRVAMLLKQKDALEAENEKLREIFSFAATEFERKVNEIIYLRHQLQSACQKIEELTKENERLHSRIEELEGSIKELYRTAFGSKSEKKKEDHVVASEHKKRGAKQQHEGAGRKIPQHLHEVEQIIELPQDQRFCPCCGLPYEETNLYETSSEVSVETIYYLKKIKRRIYKTTCNCTKTLVCAAVPAKLIPKGKFSTEFWTNVLINKYRNHLPVQRQIAEMNE